MTHLVFVLSFTACLLQEPFRCRFGEFLILSCSGALAREACGAPWVSKSTHPRKFGNHLTVHRPQPARPSAPQDNQCSISHFLASLVAQED